MTQIADFTLFCAHLASGGGTFSMVSPGNNVDWWTILATWLQVRDGAITTPMLTKSSILTIR
jgi:hypothetical protein